MPVLKVLEMPDERLRVKAKPVQAFTDEMTQLVSDMFETMYQHNGVGLAATQVGVDMRLFVMDISEDRSKKYCVVNPEIISANGVMNEMEGCLSVPHAYERVRRPNEVYLRAMDQNGNPFELHAEGLMAACIHHENDHLNGKLFIDYLSKLKQERIRKKVQKHKR